MNRIELVKTLELLKPALAKTDTVPIFQSFTFNSNGTVSAYDGIIAIVGPSELEEYCGIHGTTLLGLLSNSKSEEIDFKFEDNTATIKLGKTVSKLPYSSFDDFIFKETTQDWAFKIPFTASLAEAIKICLETVSTDETQPALQGVTIEGNRLYSCNGDAVTRIQIKAGIKDRVLMSIPFCNAVLKLWDATEATKGTLHFNEEWVYAEMNDWSVYGGITKIEDPIDFDALIKKSMKTKITTQALPPDFSEALSRARVLSDPESQKTIITVEKSKLTLHTETFMGEISDTLLFKGHPDVEANVNASHLQKAIQYCDQIAFLDNCTVLEKAPDVLLLVSNMS